jgi:hypothetical protein
MLVLRAIKGKNKFILTVAFNKFKLLTLVFKQNY